MWISNIGAESCIEAFDMDTSQIFKIQPQYKNNISIEKNNFLNCVLSAHNPLILNFSSKWKPITKNFLYEMSSFRS